MYALLWRSLPGLRWVRALIVLVALAALVAVLFSWVFPAIAPLMPFNDGTVSEEGARAVS